MTETTLTKRILKELRAAGAVAVKYHGGPFGTAGTPDILGCCNQISFAIEVKVGKNDTSAIQKERIREWESAGAYVKVAREDFDVDDFIEELENQERWL